MTYSVKPPYISGVMSAIVCEGLKLMEGESSSSTERAVMVVILNTPVLLCGQTWIVISEASRVVVYKVSRVVVTRMDT